MMKKTNSPVPATATGQKKNKTVRIVVTVLIIAAVLGGIAAFVLINYRDYKQYAAERKTVAVCNGYDIPYEELRFVTMYYKQYLADRYGEGIWTDPAKAEQYREELTRLVTKNLNQNYVILSACRQLGIDTESDDLEEQIDQNMAELRAEIEAEGMKLSEFLEENYMTENYCRTTLTINLLTSVIHETMLKEGLYHYNTGNIGDFIDYVEASDQYTRVIHIYIENKEGDDAAANLAEAQRISDELQAITDPEERLKKMREGISRVDDAKDDVTGNGFYFTYGEYEEAYEKAAFALEVGEVSEPVVCSGGNFVLMCLEREEEYITQNVSTLLNNYYGVELGRYIDQFRSQCEVAFTEYGKSIDLVAMN